MIDKTNQMKIPALFVLSLLCLTLISAWPYQLNLSDGTIIDLNSSNNETANLTIYVLNYTYSNITYFNNTYPNNTYLNLTNYTYVNQSNWTCLNCTYNVSNFTTVTNVSNFTYFLINATNNTIYNRTEAEAKFMAIAEFNSFKNGLSYATKAEFDVLKANVTNTIIKETSHGGLWGVVIFTLIIASIGAFLSFKIMKGEEDGLGGFGGGTKRKESFDSQFN